MTQAETKNKTKRILVSGFKPFAGHTVNPTEELMLKLGQISFKNIELKTIVLPVSYNKAFKTLEESIHSLKPDIVIATGLAADRQQISLERVAINCESSSYPDNDGDVAVERKIMTDAEDGIFTSLPLTKIFDAIKELNIPVQISNTAGTYVCNSLMYKMLKQFSKTYKCGFIHIPKEEHINMEQLLLVMKTTIEVVATSH